MGNISLHTLGLPEISGNSDNDSNQLEQFYTATEKLVQILRPGLLSMDPTIAADTMCDNTITRYNRSFTMPSGRKVVWASGNEANLGNNPDAIGRWDESISVDTSKKPKNSGELRFRKIVSTVGAATSLTDVVFNSLIGHVEIANEAILSLETDAADGKGELRALYDTIYGGWLFTRTYDGADDMHDFDDDYSPTPDDLQRLRNAGSFFLATLDEIGTAQKVTA
jgi:hypothetical protein